MKICIITMISDNYGNRLQNYALQEVLKDLGHVVETIHNPWRKKYNISLEKCKFLLLLAQKVFLFLWQEAFLFYKSLQ